MFPKLNVAVLNVLILCFIVANGESINNSCNTTKWRECNCSNADAVGGILGFIIIVLVVALVICCLLLAYPRWIRPQIDDVQYLTSVRDLLDRALHNPTYDSAAPMTRPVQATPTQATPTIQRSSPRHQYETIDSRRAAAIAQNQRVSHISNNRDSTGNYSLAGPPSETESIPIEPQPYEIVGVASPDGHNIDPTRYEVAPQNSNNY